MKQRLMACHLVALLILFFQFAFSQGVFPIKKEGKWGAIDSLGKVVIQPVYDAFKIRERGIWAEIGYDKYYLPLGNLSRQIGPALSISYHGIGRLLVVKGGLQGLYDLDGNVVVPCEYDEIEYWQGNNFLLVKDSLKGLVNEQGEVLLPLVYTHLRSMGEESYSVGIGGAQRLINLSNGSSLDGDWERVYPLGNGFQAARNLGGWRLINPEGNLVDGPVFEDIQLGGAGTMIGVIGSLYYFLDEQGKKLLDKGFEETNGFKGKVAKVKNKGKWGLINRKGECVLPCIYDRIGIGTGFAVAKRADKQEHFILDENGRKTDAKRFMLAANRLKKMPVEPIQNRFGGWGSNFAQGELRGTGWFRASNLLWGLRKRERFVILPSYGSVLRLERGDLSLTFSLRRERILVGLVNHQRGRILIQPAFLGMDVDQMLKKEFFRVVLENGTMAMVNRKGERISPKEIKYIGPFRHGVAPACRGCKVTTHLRPVKKLVEGRCSRPVLKRALNKVSAKGGVWGFVDEEGQWVKTPHYQGLTAFDSLGNALFCKDGLWGMLDTNQTEKLSPQFKTIELVASSNQAAYRVVSRAERFGFKNRRGKLLIQPQFVATGCFQEGMCPVAIEKRMEKDGKIHRLWGYINELGAWVIEPQFFSASCFYEGRAWVKKGREVFPIDRSGIRIGERSYSRFGPYSEGVARVYFNNRWGYIDAGGNWLIEPRYLEVSDFREGRAAVRYKKGWKWVDRQGKKLGNASAAEVENWKNESVDEKVTPSELQRVNYGGRAGLLEPNGQLLLQPLYEKLSLTDQLFQVQSEGSIGYLNPEGEWVWPLQK